MIFKYCKGTDITSIMSKKNQATKIKFKCFRKNKVYTEEKHFI